MEMFGMTFTTVQQLMTTRCNEVQRVCNGVVYRGNCFNRLLSLALRYRCKVLHTFRQRMHNIFLKSIKSHKACYKADPGIIFMIRYCSEDEAVVKRITVTLDDETHQELQAWAEDETRTVPNLLAWLAIKALKEKSEKSS